MDDLKRKGDDMDRVTDLSHDLQDLLNVRLMDNNNNNNNNLCSNQHKHNKHSLILHICTGIRGQC